MADELMTPEIPATFQPPTVGMEIKRDALPPDPARAALVTELTDKIRAARKHWEPKFKAMRNNQKFVHGKQWPGMADSGDSDAAKPYVVNLALSHINQRVSAIYAKNPRVVAKRRDRMDFMVWDGDPETLKAAQDILQPPMPQMQPGMPPPMPPPPPDPTAQANALQILDDVQQGMARRAMLDRIGKTAEKLLQYFFDEPIPKLKLQLKQMIRRIDTCGVGYLKLGYQREYKSDPTIAQNVRDCSTQIAELERQLADRADGEIQDDTANLEKLRISLKTLQEQEYLLVREGLAWTFLRSWQIIPDTATQQLKGFVGSRWLAEEWLLSPEEIKRFYKIDIGTGFTKYNKDGATSADAKDCKACLWIYYDLEQHVCYHVIDGYFDFLKEGQPDIEVEQFHPIFALTFNDLEDDSDIFPPSEVDLIRPQCMQVNLARQGLSNHRQANRPGYVSAAGVFTKDDKSKLAGHADSEVVELDGVSRSEKIGDVLMAKPTIPISPELYDVEPFFVDIQRQRQTQEANFGGVSGGTATESTIAESGRVSGIQSTIDDLDEWLTDVVRAAGQVLLKMMSPATVKKIVGPGALWPELARDEIASEIYLDIKAGSTGRPNKALEIANIERLMPFAMQTGEISPKWLAQKLVERMDDTVEMSEAMLSGALPILAMARMSQPPAANPMNDPTNQGGAGAQNTPAGPQADAQGQGQMGVGAVSQTASGLNG